MNRKMTFHSVENDGFSLLDLRETLSKVENEEDRKQKRKGPEETCDA